MPAISVPDTVAVTVPSFPAGTVHTYVHVVLEAAVMMVLVTKPLIEILGEDAMSIEKTAVIVTSSFCVIILSESVLDKFKFKAVFFLMYSLLEELFGLALKLYMYAIVLLSPLMSKF